MNGWMDRRMNGWMDRRMNGWKMEGRWVGWREEHSPKRTFNPSINFDY